MTIPTNMLPLLGMAPLADMPGMTERVAGAILSILPSVTDYTSSQQIIIPDGRLMAILSLAGPGGSGANSNFSGGGGAAGWCGLPIALSGRGGLLTFVRTTGGSGTAATLTGILNGVPINMIANAGASGSGTTGGAGGTASGGYWNRTGGNGGNGNGSTVGGGGGGVGNQGSNGGNGGAGGGIGSAPGGGSSSPGGGVNGGGGGGGGWRGTGAPGNVGSGAVPPLNNADPASAGTQGDANNGGAGGLFGGGGGGRGNGGSPGTGGGSALRVEIY